MFYRSFLAKKCSTGQRASFTYMLQFCDKVRLSNGDDKLWWNLNQNGRFTVSSFYRQLMQQSTDFPQIFLWKIKVPLKIRIFLWLITQKSILTKDVLLHRGWKGDARCQFCGTTETIDHLFLHCTLARFCWNVIRCAFDLPSLPNTVEEIWTAWLPSFAGKNRKLAMVGVAGLVWVVWNTRNDACFRNVRLTSPFGVIKRFCYFLNLWSLMQTKERNRNLLQWGVRLVEEVSREIFEAAKGWNPLRQQIAWI